MIIYYFVNCNSNFLQLVVTRLNDHMFDVYVILLRVQAFFESSLYKFSFQSKTISTNKQERIKKKKYEYFKQKLKEAIMKFNYNHLVRRNIFDAKKPTKWG